MDANITRLRTLNFLLLSFLLLLAVTARAAGLREILIPADSSGSQISAQIWTPCATPPGAIVVSSEAGERSIQGVKNCAVTGTNLPLILISHGLFGDVFSHHDTAEFLADNGFAVVSLNHTLDSVSAIQEKTADSIASFLVRPVDIKRAISFLLKNSQLSVDIDSRRIGFFGFSRGGYTGLVLAGAAPNFHAPPFPCPEEYLMCKQIRDKDIPDHDSGHDPRIRAFVIADPISFFPDQASLKNVTAPIQLWSSEHGGMGVRPEDVASVEKNLPDRPEFHRPVNSGHFSFLFPCSQEVAKQAAFLCTDPPGFDRAEFHKKLNAQVLEFFRKNLPSDSGG
jgi:predicted dienelactone hydrolase